jgi:glucokinase
MATTLSIGTLSIGVDVGGTKVAAGVVDAASGRILTRARRSTPAHDGDSTAATIVDLVRELASGHDVAAVGLGIPGFVNLARDTVLASPNLALPSRPFADQVTEATGLPTALENDANAAAWAEYRYGAAAGHDDVLVVTVGTGIGGGLVLGGRLHRGGTGVAAEIGHLRVVRDGRLCGCGQRGCWETYGSGTALTSAARRHVASGHPDASLLSSMANGSATALDGAMVTAAARAGDPLALRLFAEVGGWLGEGIASLVAVLDPGLVVVGGGAADAGSILLDPLREALSSHRSGANAAVPEVVAATLGNDAGMVGVADLALCLVGVGI